MKYMVLIELWKLVFWNLTGILSDSREQSDGNFFISCKTSEQVIGHSWKELLLSSGKESVNLRRASTGFAVVSVTQNTDILSETQNTDIQLIRVNSKRLRAGM